ncbi:MAG: mechanosensitive ion channel family protein, partial [Candidatus Binataceae bacterium]
MNLKQLSARIEFLPRYLDLHIFGTNIGPWLAFLFVAVLMFALLLCLRFILKRILGRLALSTSSALGDLVVALIGRTKGLVLLILALRVGSLALRLTEREAGFANIVAAIAVLTQIGLWGNQIIAYTIEHVLRRRADEDQGLATAAGALSFISRVVLWSLVGLLVLSCLRINITTLIAGLGVGGIAVALAVQNILGDLFASLSILIDKPFAVGHFITVDNLAGTVAHVGVKSTRVRSLSGEEIVFSNSDLLKTRIHNYKRLFERRVLFAFGVTYDTQPDKLAAIPKMLSAIIQSIDKTRFDRAHFK